MNNINWIELIIQFFGQLVIVYVAIKTVSKQIQWNNKNQGYGKREEAYESFINLLFRVIAKKESEENMNKFMVELRAKMMLFSTIEVMNAWQEFVFVSVNKSADHGMEALETGEKLIIAMREELGVPSKKIKTGDILRILLDQKGYDEFMEYIKNKN